ncbi:MAG: nucleotidyl transferase AbiEii/AbiGii toxin family protein [Streptosporangiaceae bacterium]
MAEPACAYIDLTARLRTWADSCSMDMSAARLRVVYERLLARMDSAAPLRWVVRGGRAIDLRFGGHARRSADLDVSLADTALAGLAQLRQPLSEVCHTDLGDGWTMTLTRLQRSLVAGIGVVGYQAWLAAAYDARPFGEVSLDVSSARTSAISPEILIVPEMLADARLRVAAVRPEVQIAEKVHAFTRPYRSPGPRPRSYDLVDAVALVLFTEPSRYAGAAVAGAEDTRDIAGVSPHPARHVVGRWTELLHRAVHPDGAASGERNVVPGP